MHLEVIRQESSTEEKHDVLVNLHSLGFLNHVHNELSDYCDGTHHTVNCEHSHAPPVEVLGLMSDLEILANYFEEAHPEICNIDDPEIDDPEICNIDNEHTHGDGVFEGVHEIGDEPDWRLNGQKLHDEEISRRNKSGHDHHHSTNDTDIFDYLNCHHNNPVLQNHMECVHNESSGAEKIKLMENLHQAGIIQTIFSELGNFCDGTHHSVNCGHIEIPEDIKNIMKDMDLLNRYFEGPGEELQREVHDYAIYHAEPAEKDPHKEIQQEQTIAKLEGRIEDLENLLTSTTEALVAHTEAITQQAQQQNSHNGYYMPMHHHHPPPPQMNYGGHHQVMHHGGHQQLQQLQPMYCYPPQQQMYFCPPQQMMMDYSCYQPQQQYSCNYGSFFSQPETKATDGGDKTPIFND